MKSYYIRYVRLFALTLAICIAGGAPASESINWRSYEEGMVLGKIEKKKVFLHFYADWCAFCRKMAKDTFQDSTVIAYLNENFIPVMVNTDKDQETAADYGVLGLPFTVFLTEVGEPIVSVPGYIPPDTLLSMLKEINGLKKSSY
jgi:thiol:disulfide interchange protein